MGVAREQKVYAQHVLALFRPGSVGPAHPADPNKPGDLEGWSPEDLELLVEEGRRQTDRQTADLERVRGRAQVLLALSLALTGAAASLIDDVDVAGHVAIWGFWILAIAFGGWALLGAAATATVAAEPEIIHASVLSRYDPPIQDQLAADYAAIVIKGENELAVRLTDLRWGVTHLLVAALMALVVLTWTQLDETSSGKAGSRATPLVSQPGSGPMHGHGSPRAIEPAPVP